MNQQHTLTKVFRSLGNAILRAYPALDKAEVESDIKVLH